MNISNYIKDILYTHKQVNIPGFGAFIRRTESAKLGESKETIQAPVTSISFDETIIEDDNVLTNYLVQNGKIEPNEAKELIADYVSELKKKLEANEVEEFNQIGELKYDTNKTIVFTKDKKSTFLPNTFAMSELQVTPINETEVPEEEKKKKPIWIWIAIAAAVAVILIILIPGPGKDYVDDMIEDYATKEPIVEDVDTIPEKDTLEKVEIAPEEEVIEEVITPDMKFHIVVGSFGDQVNAETLKAKLIKNGYPSASVLPKDGEWVRVSMAGFSERKSAESEMKKINSENPKYEIWLFEIK